MIIIRFADDFIVGFEHRQDAERFRDELGGRLARFGLELHPGKTRLIEFGRRAARDRAARGEGKPETFTFLGFTHICATSKTRAVLDQAENRLETGTGQACRGESRDQAAPEPAHPRTGTMAGRRGTRAPGLLRGARQQRRGERLPHPGDTALAQGAAAPQPANPDHLGQDEPHRDPVDTPDPHRAPIPAISCVFARYKKAVPFDCPKYMRQRPASGLRSAAIWSLVQLTVASSAPHVVIRKPKLIARRRPSARLPPRRPPHSGRRRFDLLGHLSTPSWRTRDGGPSCPRTAAPCGRRTRPSHTARSPGR